jgi:hypothetical protein
MAKIDDYMVHFAREVGLEKNFRADFPGVYMFSLGDVAVTVSDKSPEIILSASFGPIPKQNQETFFADLLTATLFYQGTQGSTLGINSEQDRVVVKRVIDHDVSDKEFTEEMEDFLNAVEVWKEKVRDSLK